MPGGDDTLLLVKYHHNNDTVHIAMDLGRTYCGSRWHEYLFEVLPSQIDQVTCKMCRTVVMFGDKQSEVDLPVDYLQSERPRGIVCTPGIGNICVAIALAAAAAMGYKNARYDVLRHRLYLKEGFPGRPTRR